MMPALVRLFPHHEHFVSVFGGSGADILGKPRSRLESFNDLDGQVYNLFCLLQQRTEHVWMNYEADGTKIGEQS